MDTGLKRKLVAGTVVALALAGGGAAIAATQLDSSPSERSAAVVNDAAQQLGVQPSALSSALKKALEDQVDADVTAGRLAKAEGDAIKTRIESGDFPIFGGGLHHADGGHLAGLDAAASYLGLTEAELRTQLEGGKTLAQVATAQGKSLDGLVTALTDAATTKLDAAVAAGRLTSDQEQSILTDLKQHVTDMVNGVRPSHAYADGDGFRPGPGF